MTDQHPSLFDLGKVNVSDKHLIPGLLSKSHCRIWIWVEAIPIGIVKLSFNKQARSGWNFLWIF